MPFSYKSALAAIIGVVLLVAAPVFLIASPAQSQDNICTVDAIGGTPVATITNTIEIPGPTVTLPAATVTVPVIVPGPTVKVPGNTLALPGVTIPGVRVTETLREPTATVTKTVTAESIKTVTAAPRPRREPLSTPTALDTVSAAGSGGQESSDDDTISGEQPTTNTVYSDKEIITTVTTGVLLLSLLGLLALYMGYVIGYKDRERSEKNFLSALRDQMLGKS